MLDLKLLEGIVLKESEMLALRGGVGECQTCGSNCGNNCGTNCGQDCGHTCSGTGGMTPTDPVVKQPIGGVKITDRGLGDCPPQTPSQTKNP